jgi:UDP-sugar transporter A1/2/3
MDQLLSPKAFSLVSLTVQNTALVILMRLAAEQTSYFASVAVVLDESIKLVVCTIILLIFYITSKKTVSYGILRGAQAAEEVERGLSISGGLKFLQREVFGSLSGFLSMSIPAVCYTIQKNLSFYAISKLSPAVYQILFQSKVLTTAFFSFVIMRKEFSRNQKISLITLFVGLCLVELSHVNAQPAGGSAQGFLAGSVAALLACLSSGFTAVFIEYAIKKMGETEQKPYTVWVRNIQLSIFGVISAVLAAIAKEKEAIDYHGVFHGFNGTVWAMIATGSLGGLLVSLVVKYADNILKTFATSVAIIATAVLSTFLFDFQISALFVLGTVLVLYSIYLYSSPNKASEGTPPPLNESRMKSLEDAELSPINRP